MTAPLPLAGLSRGALRALFWAVRFYLEHAWPLVAIAAFPAVARSLLALRIPHQMRPASTGAIGDAFVALWRAVLLLAIAGLDLLPNASLVDSIWPGAWASQLAGRIGGMSGRGLEWLGLGAAIAIVVLAIALIMRVATAPVVWAWIFGLRGTRPPVARRRAEAFASFLGNMITIPLTTLLLYSAVARAAICLRH